MFRSKVTYMRNSQKVKAQMTNAEAQKVVNDRKKKAVERKRGGRESDRQTDGQTGGGSRGGRIVTG